MTSNPSKPAPHDDEAVADHFDLRLRQENRSMPGREDSAADTMNNPADARPAGSAPTPRPKKPRR